MTFVIKDIPKRLYKSRTLVVTARPDRRVIRRASSASGSTRRNSSGSNGDSYRMGVRTRGFDRGRRLVSIVGVVCDASASLIRNVREGCKGDDRRKSSTVNPPMNMARFSTFVMFSRASDERSFALLCSM